MRIGNVEDIWHGSSNIRGFLGEIVVKEALKPAFSPYTGSKDYFFNSFNHKVPKKMHDYLAKYWNTIDLFKFNIDETNKEIKNLVIIEVKTKRYIPKLDKKLKKFGGQFIVTQNEINALMEAESLGFEVYLAKVTFFFRWKFAIKLISLKKALPWFKIRNGKMYDSKKYPLVK